MQKRAQLKESERSILTTNIHVFYISLFLVKTLKSVKLSTNTNTPKIEISTNLSCFFLPTTKKTVIFLRAPYKNKLARLNILQVNHRFVISGLIKMNCLLNNPFIGFFKNLNFSSVKIKHVRTNLSYSINSLQNFTIHNYN